MHQFIESLGENGLGEACMSLPKPRYQIDDINHPKLATVVKYRIRITREQNEEYNIEFSNWLAEAWALSIVMLLLFIFRRFVWMARHEARSKAEVKERFHVVAGRQAISSRGSLLKILQVLYRPSYSSDNGKERDAFACYVAPTFPSG